MITQNTSSTSKIRHPLASTPALVLLAAGAISGIPAAHADNKRLNDGVVANVYTIQHQAGCTTNLHINPQLRLAAQWHTNDVLNNRSLNGDIGSDESTPQDRAAAAGFHGRVAETVAINPALAIMRDCANSEIGVWSENRVDRSVVVAVYGEPG